MKEGDLPRQSENTAASINILLLVSVCLASEKTEMNNLRSSQSHQVNRSFPCSVGEGFNVGLYVCGMRLQFGVKEERKLKQREASAVPLHLLAVLGVKSVWLAD